MRDYPIKTASQVASLLRSFRKRSGRNQTELATLLGAFQQGVSRIERDPGSLTLERLLKVLAALDVELVLRDKKSDDDPLTLSKGPSTDRW